MADGHPGAEKRILVVVPARGGSRGVPRKNVRLLHGRPLIGHVLTTLRASRHSPDIWVSTDDDEIAEVAARFAVDVLRRPAHLADDSVTLDPVVCHAVQNVESRLGSPYDVVATVQPTSPLLSVRTFDAAVEAVLDGEHDSAITVVEDRHLRWKGPLDAPQAEFSRRLNRQDLPPVYRETGAVLATRREFVTPEGRFGPRVRLVPVDQREAVDIDSYSDWWLADNYLAHRRIGIRVDGGGAIGLGHVYRAITLSSRLFNHEIAFFMNPALPDGIDLAEAHGMNVVPCADGQFLDSLEDFGPDIVFLDILDTDIDLVQTLRDRDLFVVTFEDLGPGSGIADLVFNALYQDPKADGRRRYSGPDFVCLREEFYSVGHHTTREDVEEVLVTFGGTDPNNLTLKTLQALESIEGDFRVTVVLGLGYKHEGSLPDPSRFKHACEYVRNTRSISSLMERADLAVSSAGRTVFELIACQTPSLVMAQNERELLHTSADEGYGVRNLGLGASIGTDQLAQALQGLMPYRARQKLHLKMLELDLWHGPERVLEKIFSEYEMLERYRQAMAREPNPEEKVLAIP